MVVDGLFRIVHAAVTDLDGVAIEDFSKLVVSLCISLVLKENSVMQCNECTVHLLTLGIPEGFLVCSIMVVYSGFKSKVIIPQQQFQHSHFQINKHQYSSVNINMKVFDSGLNKGLHLFYNQAFNCFINKDF